MCLRYYRTLNKSRLFFGSGKTFWKTIKRRRHRRERAMMMEADDDDDDQEEEEDLDAEIRSLGTLIENGIGKRFDAAAYAGRRWWWCDDDDDDDTGEMMMEDVCFDCTPDGFRRREESGGEGRGEMATFDASRAIFEQIRPEVMRLMAFEEIREMEREEEEEESRQKGSRSRRKSRNNFVYGEVVLEPFFEFVSRSSELCTPTKETKKYYDLGSGSGKSVFIAALTGKFSFAGGSEILKCLHGVATTVVEDYKQIIEPMMKRRNSNRKMKTELRVDLNDIFSPECVRMWSQCEYVFCNCLTWEDGQMESLARAAEHLKEGSIFVTVLLPLPSDKFEVIAEEECLFSWGGKAPLVVHKKRRQLEGENDLLASLGKMNNWRRE